MSTVMSLVKIKLMSFVDSAVSFMRGKKRTDTGNSAGGYAIIVLIVLAFLAMLIFMFAIFTALLFQARMTDCTWFFFMAGGIASLVFALMGSVFSANSYLFDATDNDLLLCMPIKPSAILLSRALTLYVFNLVYSLLILLPEGLAYYLFGGFTPLTVLYYVLSLLLIPLLATALSCIMGFIIGRVGELIPNKNLLSIIFGFIMLAVLIVLVIALTPLLNSLIENLAEISESVKQSCPPLYWYGAAMNGERPLYIFFVLLVCAAPMVIVFAYLSKKFVKMVTREKSVHRKEYVPASMRKTPVQLSLLKKELAHFFGTPGYVMNAGLSTIMTILVGFTIFWQGDTITRMVDAYFTDSSGGLVPLAVGMLLAMSCMMNDVSAPTISTEGKTMWVLRSTPTKTMNVFISKALLNPIVSSPGIIFTAIASAVRLSISSLDVLFIILAPALACMFSGFLGVCINLKLPRLDWTSEITVIKQSMSVIITLLLSMLFTAIPFVFAVIPVAYLEDFSYLWSYLICIGYFAALIGLEIFYLTTDGKKIFEHL